MVHDIKQCTDNPVTRYFMDACHGQKHCNLTASPRAMDAEGCSQLYVYLKTVYACVEVGVIKEEFVDRDILATVVEDLKLGNESDDGDKKSEKSEKIENDEFKASVYSNYTIISS